MFSKMIWNPKWENGLTKFCEGKLLEKSGVGFKDTHTQKKNMEYIMSEKKATVLWLVPGGRVIPARFHIHFSVQVKTSLKWAFRKISRRKLFSIQISVYQQTHLIWQSWLQISNQNRGGQFLQEVNSTKVLYRREPSPSVLYAQVDPQPCVCRNREKVNALTQNGSTCSVSDEMKNCHSGTMLPDNTPSTHNFGMCANVGAFQGKRIKVQNLNFLPLVVENVYGKLKIGLALHTDLLFTKVSVWSKY